MTSMEWLIEQLTINNYISDNAHWLIDDAKEMEKQQIVDAFNEGYFDEKTAEQYYNETFKTK